MFEPTLQQTARKVCSFAESVVDQLRNIMYEGLKADIRPHKKPRLRGGFSITRQLPVCRLRPLALACAAAFNQRRKMLRSALKGHAPGIEDHLIAAGLTPTDRAEQIPIEGFCALARSLAQA
jgi:hypothetical protein